MTQCIKCGRNIRDGELFCAQCSKSPVIAELNSAGQQPRRPAPRPVQPVQRSAASNAAARNTSKKLKTALVCVSIALAVVLAILLVQQGKLQVEKNRLRTEKDEFSHQLLKLAETEQDLEQAQADLAAMEQTLKEKEQQIKELNAQLTESRSSQNQGEYDLNRMEQQLQTLQEEYDTMKEEWDLMEQAVEAAAKFKEKAEFLDSYVVFVMNNGTNLYHTYDCDDFTHSGFWTYSPKLAQKQGYDPCPKCIEE